MKCFNHQQADAVGVCLECGKGICPECASDTGDGIYCIGKCKEPKRSKIRRKGRQAVKYALAATFFIPSGFFVRDEVIKAGHIFIGAGFAFVLISIDYCYSWIKLKRKNPAS